MALQSLKQILEEEGEWPVTGEGKHATVVYIYREDTSRRIEYYQHTLREGYHPSRSHLVHIMRRRLPPPPPPPPLVKARNGRGWVSGRNSSE